MWENSLKDGSNYYIFQDTSPIGLQEASWLWELFEGKCSELASCILFFPAKSASAKSLPATISISSFCQTLEKYFQSKNVSEKFVIILGSVSPFLYVNNLSYFTWKLDYFLFSVSFFI